MGPKEVKQQKSPKNLSNRVNHSTRSLVRSTFSGTEGLEAALTDAGVHGKTTRITVRGNAAHIDIPVKQPHGVRRLEKERSHSFRACVPNEALEQKEREFAGFLKGTLEVFTFDARASDTTMDFESLSSSIYQAIMDPKVNTNPLRVRKQRRVNQDPYGGDGFIWDDSDFFSDFHHNVTSTSEPPHVDDQCAEFIDRNVSEDESERQIISNISPRVRGYYNRFNGIKRTVFRHSNNDPGMGHDITTTTYNRFLTQHLQT